MNLILLCIAAAIPAYVLGSVNGAIITSKYLYRKDIRKYGSGNPGLTNFFRVFGKAGVVLVVFIDVVKTVAPVLLGGFLLGHYDDPGMKLFGQEFAGFFVLLGHCYPIFYGFQGGKGIMAAGTILIVIDWRLALICWGVFIVITAATRYVSLGAIIGVAAFPASQIILSFCGVVAAGTIENIVAIACAALTIARHHANIGRLVKGQESKLKMKK